MRGSDKLGRYRLERKRSQLKITAKDTDANVCLMQNHDARGLMRHYEEGDSEQI